MGRLKRANREASMRVTVGWTNTVRPQPWRSGTSRLGGTQPQRHEPRPMKPCNPQAYVCIGTLGVLFASAVSSASDFISYSSVFVRCACEAVSDHFAHSL